MMQRCTWTWSTYQGNFCEFDDTSKLAVLAIGKGIRKLALFVATRQKT